ncbi:MAG TPA: hypothetical protein VK903_04530 [Propionicimonas sp.]|nr:hypothetical protein [Propionicimonas sp.]
MNRPVVRRWALPILVAGLYLVAGFLNAGPLLAGARPGVAGQVASVAYGAAWLGWAFVAGRGNGSRSLRGMAGFWALVIASAAMCSTFVRLDARSGVAASGWTVASLLVVTTAPLYGLAGAFTGEPLTALTAIAVGTGALTVALAAAARKLAPAAS